jgi:hypothetical protein
MNFDLRRSAVAAALIVVLFATASDQGVRTPTMDHLQSGGRISALHQAAEMIGRWPDKPRALAGMLIEKYGVPDEMVSSQLSWKDCGAWARVVVFRDPETPGQSNHLLEAVAYGTVPFDRWREFHAFGRGAGYDPLTRELSARTDSEATNFMALNLADEVIRGVRSGWEARGVYDATQNLSVYGKSSPYMTGLLFQARARELPKVTGEDAF